jgi:hypothetical protein
MRYQLEMVYKIHYPHLLPLYGSLLSTNLSRILLLNLFKEYFCVVETTSS